MDRDLEIMGYVEEYKSLREEILKRQEACNITLGLTVTVIGTVIGLALGLSSNSDVKDFVSGILIFSYFLIIAAVLFTNSNTMQIDIIAMYIRMCIEPRVEGIKWEGLWHEIREHTKNKSGGVKDAGKEGRMPLGTFKFTALYYVFLSIGLLILTISMHVDNHHYGFIIVYFMFAVSICIELIVFTKGRRLRWSRISLGWRLLEKMEERMEQATQEEIIKSLLKPPLPG